MNNLKEDLSKWNHKYWIHYSDVNYIKVNNHNPNHDDPLGVYFFPFTWEHKSMIKYHWSKKKFKMIVSLKLGNLNIFDISTKSVDDLSGFLENIGISNGKRLLTSHDWIFDMDNSFKSMFKTDKTPLIHDKLPTPQELWWEILKLKSRGSGKMLTQYFVNNNYDGIFDDTELICPKEVQLILFNDDNIKIHKTIPQ